MHVFLYNTGHSKCPTSGSIQYYSCLTFIFCIFMYLCIFCGSNLHKESMNAVHIKRVRVIKKGLWWIFPLADYPPQLQYLLGKMQKLFDLVVNQENGWIGCLFKCHEVTQIYIQLLVQSCELWLSHFLPPASVAFVKACHKFLDWAILSSVNSCSYLRESETWTKYNHTT